MSNNILIRIVMTLKRRSVTPSLYEQPRVTLSSYEQLSVTPSLYEQP